MKNKILFFTLILFQLNVFAVDPQPLKPNSKPSRLDAELLGLGLSARDCGKILTGFGALVGTVGIFTIGGGLLTGHVGFNGIQYGKIVKIKGGTSMQTTGAYVPVYNNAPIDGNNQFSGIEYREEKGLVSDYQFVLDMKDGSEITVDVSQSSVDKYKIGDSYRLTLFYKK